MNFTVLDNMSMAVDMFDCLSLELYRKKIKSVIITCVDRTPASHIELFTDWIEEIFTSKSHKTIFPSGDFNIDLLNPNKHKVT